MQSPWIVGSLPNTGTEMATFPGILTTEKGREIHGCHNKYDYLSAHKESTSKPAYFFGSSNPSECAKLNNFACCISTVDFQVSRPFFQYGRRLTPFIRRTFYLSTDFALNLGMAHSAKLRDLLLLVSMRLMFIGYNYDPS